MRKAPPKLPDLIIRLLIRGALGDAIAGDLSEEYVRFVRPNRGRLAANLWFWRQVLGSLPAAFEAQRHDRKGFSPLSNLMHRPGRSSADSLRQDVRYGLRGLVRRPGFTLVALLTLALGIGANTAIFSVVNAVVLRPLPYRAPSQLVKVWPDLLFPFRLRSGIDFVEQVHSYEDLTLYGRRLFSLTGDGEPEILRGAVVTWNHFNVLGAAPALGRGFRQDDAVPGAEPVVVLAHRLWQRRFGSDPSVVGSSLEVSGVSHRIVGVMAPEHQPLEFDWQIWSAVQLTADALDGGNGMAAVGRLKSGVTIQAAQAESRTVYRRYMEALGESVTEEDLSSLRIVTVEDWLLGDAKSQLLVLLGSVGLLILIACANVANLLLAQGNARRKEFAVRLALGAARGRLIRQLLTEASLVGVLGGAAGVALAMGMLEFGAQLLPADIPRRDAVSLDSLTLLFALGVSLASASLFGIVPALRAMRLGLHSNLQEGGRQSASGRQLHLNHSLVATEVALAVVLVVGAGLMLRSAWKLHEVDPGFVSDGVLTLRVSAPPSAEVAEDISQFHADVIQTVESSPGIRSVGAIQFLPMRPGGWWSKYAVPGEPPPEDARLSMRVVSGEYFETLGTTVRGNELLEEWDSGSGPGITLINETLARAAFEGKEAIGRQILLGVGEPRQYTVVGVVGDVRQTDLRTPSHSEAYLPLAAIPWRSLFYAIRVDGDPVDFVQRARAAVWSVDDRAPISSVSAMADVVGETVAFDRLLTVLLSAFGVLALTLGAVGVYGVMSYAMSRRKREIGIRMAVGASTGRVLKGMVARGMIPVVIGVVIGIAAALAAGRVLASALFGVGPADAVTLVAVPAILGVVALTAVYLPARSASRSDPAMVLRNE